MFTILWYSLCKNNTLKGISSFINILERNNPRGDCWLVSVNIITFNMSTNMPIDELLIAVRHAFEKFYKLYVYIPVPSPNWLRIWDRWKIKNWKTNLMGQCIWTLVQCIDLQKPKCFKTPVLAKCVVDHCLTFWPLSFDQCVLFQFTACDNPLVSSTSSNKQYLYESCIHS